MMIGAASEPWEVLLLQQSRLVEGTRDQIDAMAIRCRSLGQTIVELGPLGNKRSLLLIIIAVESQNSSKRKEGRALLRWWCERMGSLSEGSTTLPGPIVAGPPEMAIIRAPEFGKVNSEND